MKTRTEEIDQMIEEALSKEEAAYFKEMEEDSIPGMMLDLYKGKHAWMAYLTGVMILLAFGFSLYCVFMIFQVESMELMLKWSLGFIFGLLMTSMLKIWNWMQMDKNVIIKHMKHLEYQVAILASKLNEK